LPIHENSEGKTMKKILVMLTCFFAVMTGTAMAGDWGISAGYGQSSDRIDICRAGLVKNWNGTWLANATGHVTGYFELSYNLWKTGDDKTHGVAISPVIQYAFNPGEKNWYPYIEGGVGIAYIDAYFIGNRNLSSNFQFEDRVGAGVRFDRFDLSFRYMHYSNADIKQPNHGIDIWIGSLAWFF